MSQLLRAVSRPSPLQSIRPPNLTEDDIVEMQKAEAGTPSASPVRAPLTPRDVLPISRTLSTRRKEFLTATGPNTSGSFAGMSNTQKILQIQEYFIGGQDLVANGREYILDSILTKICRKAPKPRRFFLFNDILVYGSILSKHKLSNQSILPLNKLSIVSFPDEPGRLNAFEILSAKKSFIVMADSPEEKALWMGKLTYYVNQATQDTQKKGAQKQEVEWAPSWTPDSDADFCAICQMVKFTTFTRRHHCRNCGRVVCGGCSDHEITVQGLSTKKPVRVCDECFPVLQRSNFRKKIQVSAETSAVRLEWLCDSDSDSDGEDLETLQQDNRLSKYHRTSRIHGI